MNTRKARLCRNAILEATKNTRECISHSVVIHFFRDCWLGVHKKSLDGFNTKDYMVYSRDGGKTWLPYHNQFEPAEGEHSAIIFLPTENPFYSEY